jgi:hypothetical protein
VARFMPPGGSGRDAGRRRPVPAQGPPRPGDTPLRPPTPGPPNQPGRRARPTVTPHRCKAMETRADGASTSRCARGPGASGHRHGC